MARSDQFSFIKKGVPVLDISQGMIAVDPKINGKKQMKIYWRKYYHKPCDDLNQKYFDKKFLSELKMNFPTLYYITNSMPEIKLHTESKFYKKYVLKEK